MSRVEKVLSLLEKMVRDPSLTEYHRYAALEAKDLIHELYGGITEAELAQMDFDAPDEAPNVNDCTWYELLEAADIGITRAKNIVLYRDSKGIRYNKPVDVLAVRGVGVNVVAKLIGKVRFG